MKRKLVNLPNGYSKCYLPIDDGMHEYQLLDIHGEVIIKSSWFDNLEKATIAAQKEFPNIQFKIVDLTEKSYIKLAEYYCSRIKKLRPSFKKTSLVLDMSSMYYDRNPNSWYTAIPFEHNSVQWIYREQSPNEDWIEKYK